MVCELIRHINIKQFFDSLVECLPILYDVLNVTNDEHVLGLLYIA